MYVATVQPYIVTPVWVKLPVIDGGCVTTEKWIHCLSRRGTDRGNHTLVALRAVFHINCNLMLHRGQYTKGKVICLCAHIRRIK